MAAVNVAAISIVSRNGKPLYTQVLAKTTPEEELQLHFLMYSSLDVCDERVEQRKRRMEKLAQANVRIPPLTEDPRFLNQLHQTNRYRAWGFQSTSHLKIILVVDGDFQKNDVAPLLKFVYERVSSSMCNPFREIDAELSSPAFDRDIRMLLTQRER